MEGALAPCILLEISGHGRKCWLGNSALECLIACNLGRGKHRGCDLELHQIDLKLPARFAAALIWSSYAESPHMRAFDYLVGLTS